MCYSKPFLIDPELVEKALTLHLLVLGVDLADHAHFAFAADDLAFFADSFY
jgi:hypothetical protein